MSTIKIRIKRIGSFMSRHIPYEIWFQDQKLANGINNGTNEYSIDSRKGILKIRELGSKFAFHNIEKSVVIFPEYIKNTDNLVLCEVKATINWLGVLTCGVLAPIRRVNVNVKY